MCNCNYCPNCGHKLNKEYEPSYPSFPYWNRYPAYWVGDYPYTGTYPDVNISFGAGSTSSGNTDGLNNCTNSK